MSLDVRRIDAIVGIGVFVLYVGPLLYHLVTVPCRKFANWFEKTSNRRAWGWVVDDYADEEQAGRWSFFTRSWELFTTLNKLAMLAGSATMYPKNRFFVSSVSMWYFSVVQLMVRPYTNRTNNILAIAFSVCDILGVYAAYPETSTTEIQIAFLVMTLVMVIITVALLLRSTCHKVYRLRDLDEQKSAASFSAVFAAYSRRERWFLAPILVIVWVSKNSTRCVCRRMCAAGSRRNDRLSVSKATASSVAAAPSEKTLPRHEHRPSAGPRASTPARPSDTASRGVCTTIRLSTTHRRPKDKTGHCNIATTAVAPFRRQRPHRLVRVPQRRRNGRDGRRPAQRRSTSAAGVCQPASAGPPAGATRIVDAASSSIKQHKGDDATARQEAAHRANEHAGTAGCRPRRSPHHVAPGPGRGAPGL